MINKVFSKQIGRNVETYIDDIVMKSEKIEEHVKDIEEMLVVVRKFWVKLNLYKYEFRVAVGEFQGFMVS